MKQILFQYFLISSESGLQSHRGQFHESFKLSALRRTVGIKLPDIWITESYYLQNLTCMVYQWWSEYWTKFRPIFRSFPIVVLSNNADNNLYTLKSFKICGFTLCHTHNFYEIDPWSHKSCFSAAVHWMIWQKQVDGEFHLDLFFTWVYEIYQSCH